MPEIYSGDKEIELWETEIGEGKKHPTSLVNLFWYTTDDFLSGKEESLLVLGGDHTALRRSIRDQ